MRGEWRFLRRLKSYLDVDQFIAQVALSASWVLNGRFWSLT